MLYNFGDKFYLTSRAYVVNSPEELPREMASSIADTALNPSFTWVAGRFVQAEEPNRNGQFWSTSDLEVGQASIKYTPLNVSHNFKQPVGSIVETKFINRDVADSATRLPEIQALSVVWGANFPEVAAGVKAAHDAGSLWYSMEAVAESLQCLTCERSFAYAKPRGEMCEHLAASAAAPRRFVNPIFLGGALIFPPERPGWKDAEITDIAKELTRAYAEREDQHESIDDELWDKLMHLAQSIP